MLVNTCSLTSRRSRSSAAKPSDLADASWGGGARPCRNRRVRLLGSANVRVNPLGGKG